MLKCVGGSSPFNIEHSTLNIQHSRLRTGLKLAAIAFLIFATSVLADDLSVDRRTVRVGETVSIIVSLEGAFASNETLNVPVKNLRIEGPPSVSSEFSWINGATTRRKVHRFTARPLQPGIAIVGPLVVNGDGGQRETLPAVMLQVVADMANVSNEPAVILHELLADGKEPLFVVAEVDRTNAYVGEEIVVTWVLYNAAAVEQWHIGNVPKLDDFWSEEIDIRNERPEQLMVGNLMMQRMPIRRVALFPLHSGTLRIGGMAVKAEVMRRTDNGPLAMFEGTLVETGFESAPITIEARPLPAGVAPDLVGEVTMQCAPAIQKGGGPVSTSVILRGRANLRGAPAPRFDGTIDGDVEVQPAPLTVERSREGVVMTRKWQYLIFPARSGALDVPPIVTTVFTPKTGAQQTIRCAGATLNASQSPRPQSRRAVPPVPLQSRLRSLLPWMGGVAVAVAALLLIVPRARGAMRLRREAKLLLRGKTAVETRDAVHAILHRSGLDENALAGEASDRGDAYRAFRSIVDALERDQLTAADYGAELEQRVRDLVQSLRLSDADRGHDVSASSLVK
jgi:BatD DUF11 like domain